MWAPDNQANFLSFLALWRASHIDVLEKHVAKGDLAFRLQPFHEPDVVWAQWRRWLVMRAKLIELDLQPVVPLVDCRTCVLQTRTTSPALTPSSAMVAVFFRIPMR